MAVSFFSCISLGHTFAGDNLYYLQTDKGDAKEKMSQQTIVPVKSFLPAIVIFLLVSIPTVSLQAQWQAWQLDASLLLCGNILLFVVTFCSWIFHRKALQAGNTAAFLRNVYSAMLLKLFVCMTAFFIYASLTTEPVNKPALFSLMFLYLVYTFTELSVLLKYAKRNRNA